MYRKILLFVTLNLVVYLATVSAEEFNLKEEAKMLTNNEVLFDEIAKVYGKAIILNNTETETIKYNPKRNNLLESESTGNVEDKMLKAQNNMFNESKYNTEESTIIDPNPPEVTNINIANTSSVPASDDYVKRLEPLYDTSNITITMEFTQQQSNSSEQDITTEAPTESDIKTTDDPNESSYNVNLKSNGGNDLQLSNMEDILGITRESTKTMGPNDSNSDIFSTTEYTMKTDRSDIELATTESSTEPDVSIVEAREMVSRRTSDDLLISQSTESSSQKATSAPLIASTAFFTSSRSSNAEATTQALIEPKTESVPLTKILKTSARGSTILDTSEIRNSVGDMAEEERTELENRPSSSNKNLNSETKHYTSKIKVPQTTTQRSTELHKLRTTAQPKLPSQSSSRPKQTLLPLAWYTKLIPIYPSYLLDPLKYFHNSTSQTLTGTGALPTTWNYTTLSNPPIFNFTNLLSQILLPEVSSTARHGFFRQNQSNTTKFHLFPLFKLFNITHHFNKTKFATHTQAETAINVSDVLSALLHHKHTKFHQRQTDLDNDADDGSLFVRRQWYKPLVSDNLERSEGVPFLTPVVRYRNQGQQLLTPVITYVERVEPYRIERPQYYREKPKPVKRPTTNYRKQPYYFERPDHIERPSQIEHSSYYQQPINTDVKVQSGPISYESSPMDPSYVEPFIDIDGGDVEYYYRSKKLNASLKSVEDTPKETTSSLWFEVEVPNTIYKFMKSIYNLFMPNN